MRILELCAQTVSRRSNLQMSAQIVEVEESIQDVCGSVGVDRRINQRA